MTDKDFFVYTLEQELPRFERVLKAAAELPMKSLEGYRPDPKAKNGFELIAATMGNEPLMIPEFLKTGKIDMMTFKGKEYGDVKDVIKEFKKTIKKIMKMVSEMKGSEWNKKAEMVVGDHVEWSSTRGKMAWELFLDLIHHRGQLSTYLRPMGGKVPSIYGPSADSQ